MDRDRRVADLAFPDRLLLETDGPEPLRVPRPGPSTPLWVADSARWLARRFGLSCPAFQERMDANARKFFRLERQI